MDAPGAARSDDEHRRYAARDRFAKARVARLATVDADGRPARIRFTAEVPSLQDRTRTLTTTYDYRGWGEPVDVTP